MGNMTLENTGVLGTDLSNWSVVRRSQPWHAADCL